MTKLYSESFRSIQSDLKSLGKHELAASMTELIHAAESPDRASILSAVKDFLKNEWKTLKKVFSKVGRMQKSHLRMFVKTQLIPALGPIISLISAFLVNITILTISMFLMELTLENVASRSRKLSAAEGMVDLSDITAKDFFLAVKRLITMPKKDMVALKNKIKEEW